MKSGAGFTLAEVLIVLTIITILFSIVLANYRTSEKQFSLQRSAHKLAQDLRTFQEMAMTGQKTNFQFGQVFPRGGYGIYLETDLNSYILFADCDGGSDYDESGTAASCADATSEPDNSCPEKIAEFSLESGVTISNLYPLSPLHITFFPPDPVITINPEPVDNQAIITLTFGGKTKTVTINTVGLIDID